MLRKGLFLVYKQAVTWLLCFIVLGVTCFAVPTTVFYQATLSDSSGVPLNGAISITFKLYNSTGSEVWTEAYSGNDAITLINGHFSVRLGSLTPLEPSDFNDDLSLGIQIDTDPEMTPRIPIKSVSFAYRAHILEGGKLLINGDGNVEISTHLLPSVQDTYDLGSPDRRWRDLYVSTGSIHIGTPEDGIVLSIESGTAEDGPSLKLRHTKDATKSVGLNVASGEENVQVKGRSRQFKKYLRGSGKQGGLGIWWQNKNLKHEKSGKGTRRVTYDSDLVWDFTNERLGLSTGNSPQASLHVDGDIGLTGIITQSGSQKPSGWGGGLTVDNAYSDGGTIGTGSSGNLAAYINSDGDAYLSNHLTIDFTKSLLTSDSQGSMLKHSWLSGIGDYVDYYIPGNSGGTGTDQASPALRLTDNDSNLVQVGIGVSNPTQTLDIEGDLTATAFYGNGSNLTGLASSGHTHSSVASTTHTHDATFSPVSHDHNSGYSLTSHEGSHNYSDISHDNSHSYSLLNHSNHSYAATTHTNSHAYAGLTHDHDSYFAGSSHTHSFSGATHAHSPYAATSHSSSHNSSFSATGHNHNATYVAAAHSGDHSFASTTHNHDSTFAAMSHSSSHNSSFSATSHTHTGYSETSHASSHSYSDTNHNHNSTYAATSHSSAHNSSYASTGHSHGTDFSNSDHLSGHSYSGSSHNHDSTYSGTSHTHSSAASTHDHGADYSGDAHGHTYRYNPADPWFRDQGDNHHVKFYGNSRQMAFRTSGTAEYASGVGGFPYAWMYGGDAASNREMLLNTSGQLWTDNYGWLHDKFAEKDGDSGQNYSTQELSITGSLRVTGGDVTVSDSDKGISFVTHGGGWKVVNGMTAAHNDKAIYTSTTMKAGVSLDAPIFYDQNDTSFYLDPHNKSYIKKNILMNRVQIASDKMEWIDQAISGRTNGVHSSDSAMFVAAYRDSEASDLRLYLTDDSDDMFSIWGDSCYGGDCDNLNNAEERFRFRSDGNAYAYSWSSSTTLSSSDRRLKKEIKPLDMETQFKNVLALQGVSFKFSNIPHDHGLHFGFIAQDVERLYPYLISDNAMTEMKQLHYHGLLPVLVEAVKAQQPLLDEQTQKIAEQRRAYNDLLERIEALEGNLGL